MALSIWRSERIADLAKSEDQRTSTLAPRSWTVGTVLLAGALTTALAFSYAFLQQRRDLETELTRRTATIALSFQRRMSHRLALLNGVASYIITTAGSDRASIRSFASDLSRDVAGVVTLDWVPRVGAESLPAYEEAQWVAGVSDFRVHRSGEGLAPASEYFPLHLGLTGTTRVEGLNLMPGSDLSAVPSLSATLAAARTRDAVVAAPPVKVVKGEAATPGIIMVAPVFARGRGAGEPARATDLLGYVFGLFEIGIPFEEALTEIDRASIGIELRDAGASPEARTLYQREAAASDVDSLLLWLWQSFGGGAVQHTMGLDQVGRPWAIASWAGPRFLDTRLQWTPWAVLVCGLLTTALAVISSQAFVSRGTQLGIVRDRLARERSDNMERLNRVNEELERERLEQRRTEESLFREKQQFRLMFNAVPAMIWYKDTKNRFLLVNEAAAASMGRTVKEMEGKPCSEILPAKAYDLYRDDLEIIQTGKPKLGVIEELDLPSRKSIWIRTDKLPEYDSMGRVVGILVFAQDITERLTAEGEVRRLNAELEQRVAARTAELRAANHELESFAYSVSHDLRTPLRTIDGFSQLVLDEYGEALDQSGLDYLERVRSASQRMGHLIDDLLKLTRVSRSELRREPLDLSALARQVAEDLRRNEPGRDVELIIEPVPVAKGDPVLMLNVMQNLLGNAWKFTSRTEEGARIEFGSLTTGEGRTAYYVRDNGVGFDMVYVEKLFGAFQRLHGQEDFEGSGIGLATVQLILRRHGGEVWAEGAPGKGATFYFSV